LKVSPMSINPKRFKPQMMKRMLLTMPRPDEVSEEIVGSVVEGAMAGMDLFTEDVGIDPELLPKVGEDYAPYIVRLRIARGFKSQESFRRAGEFQGNAVIGRLERGISVPAEETVAKLAKVLDVPLALVDPGQFKRLQEQGEEAQETYGEYLGRLRRAAGFPSQQHLGRAWEEKYGGTFKSGSQLINKWENNRSAPSPENVSKLAAMFGISAKTLDPKRFVPGRLLPPTLRVIEPPKPPAPEPSPDVERIQNDAGMPMGEEQMEDVQWDQNSPPPAASVPSLRQQYGAMPQFLKQHVDIFGISKTDDPTYVRIRFDAIVPRKTAGALMRELVILTTDDLLGDTSE
jgi:transcriptional regulator with XRE-family HTH domain